MPPSSVHFNGSVNLPDAETVMREISSRIPSGVRRMTDGETGERGYWILFQIQKFAQMPEFERVAAGQAYETSPDAPEIVQFRLADGRFGRHDRLAQPRLRRRLRRLVRGLRPAAAGGHDPGRTCACRSSTRRRWRRWPGRSCPRTCPPSPPPTRRRCSPTSTRCSARVPHDRVAVQWDVAVEFGLLEGAMGPGAMPLEQIAPGSGALR